MDYGSAFGGSVLFKQTNDNGYITEYYRNDMVHVLYMCNTWAIQRHLYKYFYSKNIILITIIH